MSITARKPIIDWETGFERHWNGGNPVKTHIFNALSFLFPQGERYFIRIAKDIYSQINIADNDKLNTAIKVFIRQEAMHTKQHEMYNSILEQQGYKNMVHHYINWVEKQTDHLAPIKSLAIVCAYEHFTAIVGDYILSNPPIFDDAQEKMALIWGWHGAEETEHKSVCYDLYQAAGGTWLMRVLFFHLVSLNFLLMFSRNYLNLLWQDNCLNYKTIFKTIFQLSKLFWGKKGIGWHCSWHCIRYSSPAFYPWKQNNKNKLEQWLMANENNLEILNN
ncbi:MAG: metal-dependent hydrolase [Victivallaceae bacterium]|nr:metal-dependent hydrolase [Victivallaceae bacterium]